MKKLITTCLSTLLCTSAFSFAETYVVEAHSMTFVPDVVNVAPGDVIRWEYVTGYPHDVTSGTKCKDDGYLFLDIPSGGSVEWTVPEDAPSEIPYFCTLHCGSGMTGMINVEGDEEEGHMYVGIVDISTCDVQYTEGDGTATISIVQASSSESSFAWGVEIEDGDIEVTVTVKVAGYVWLHDASAGTSSLCLSGTHTNTLLDGQKYVFHGSDTFDFSLTWPEQGDEEGMGMSIIGSNVSIHSSSSDGDNVSFRAPGNGEMVMTLTAEEDMQVPMAVIANVTSPTLTLPASGEEADVEVPVGTHTIELNGDGTGMGMLLMQMGDGDDGGGGDSLPEDVNGDGVVDVSDLLAIIGAWGATSP